MYAALWISMMMGGHLIVSVVSDPRAGLCWVATKIQASISTASAMLSDICLVHQTVLISWKFEKSNHQFNECRWEIIEMKNYVYIFSLNGVFSLHLTLVFGCWNVSHVRGGLCITSQINTMKICGLSGCLLKQLSIPRKLPYLC